MITVALKGYEGSVYLKSTISGHFSDHLLGKYMDGSLTDQVLIENENIRVQRFRGCYRLLSIIHKSIDWVLGLREAKITKNSTRINIELSDSRH